MEKSNRRVLFTVLVCIAVLFAWQILFVEPEQRKLRERLEQRKAAEAAAALARADAGTVAAPPAAATPPAAAGATAEGGAPEVAPGAEGEPAPPVAPAAPPPPERRITFDTETFKVTFTSIGASLKSVVLRGYGETTKRDSPGVEVLGPSVGTLRPLAVGFEDPGAGAVGVAVAPDAPFAVISQGRDFVVFRHEGAGVTVEKEFRLAPKPYQILLETRVTNTGSATVTDKPYVLWPRQVDLTKKDSGPSLFAPPPDTTNAACFVNGTFENEPVGELEEPERFEGEVAWAGVHTRYFLGAVVPKGETRAACTLEERAPGALVVSLMVPAHVVEPGKTATHLFEVFAGPKEHEALSAVGAQLDAAVDYDLWGLPLHYLAVPMLLFLRFSHSVIPNWGIAVILLTVLVKLLTIPLANKSYRSMEQMKALKPKLDRLKEKFGEDKERLNREMMALYKQEHVNPFGGCMPVLLQMPVYIALYRMLYSAVELRHATFVPYWIEDLSAKDPTFVMPLLLGVVFFVQQKLTPTTGMDPAQAKMMQYFMPALFTVMMLFLPSGLVLYIFINTVLGIGHQKFYQRLMAKSAAGKPGVAT